MQTQYANRDVVERRWPGLWAQLQQDPTSYAFREPLDGPEWTLRVNDIQLTSAYNRLAEARLQAEVVSELEQEAWVYGFALGDLPRVLLERARMKRLRVRILCPGVAYESLKRLDHSDWLTDPRVELALATPDAGLERPYAVAPACLRLAANHVARLRDELSLDLDQPFRDAHFAALEQEFRQRIAENQELLEADGDVRSLYGGHGGRVAVAVAAGPSLDGYLQWMQQRRDQLLLVACTTALGPMQHAGLTPDVAVIVDHNAPMLRHLEALDLACLRQIPLVYVPTVHRPVLERWPGPRLVAYLRRARFLALRERLPRGELFCAGTVAHACLDLAVRSGACKVGLLGFDFAFPRARSHAAKAEFAHEVERGSAPLWVLNRRGERVPTNSSMLGYLRDLERFLRTAPGVEFYHGAGEGAVIQGTRPLGELGLA